MVDPASDGRSSENRQKLKKLEKLLSQKGVTAPQVGRQILDLKLSPAELAILLDSDFLPIMLKALMMTMILGGEKISRDQGDTIRMALQMRGEQKAGNKISANTFNILTDKIKIMSGKRNPLGVNQHQGLRKKK